MKDTLLFAWNAVRTVSLALVLVLAGILAYSSISQVEARELTTTAAPAYLPATVPLLHLPVRDGRAFLPPAEVLYARRHDTGPLLKPVGGEALALDLSWAALSGKLGLASPFFHADSVILNCRHVRQVLQQQDENGEPLCLVRMADEELLVLPITAMEDLLGVMEGL